MIIKRENLHEIFLPYLWSYFNFCTTWYPGPVLPGTPLPQGPPSTLYFLISRTCSTWHPSTTRSSLQPSIKSLLSTLISNLGIIIFVMTFVYNCINAICKYSLWYWSITNKHKFQFSSLRRTHVSLSLVMLLSYIFYQTATLMIVFIMNYVLHSRVGIVISNFQLYLR